MSKILITALVFEGVGFFVLLVSAIALLVKGENPSFIESFIIGQIFFNMGIMFHLGYLTALVRKK
jgi:hypothetical protein